MPARAFVYIVLSNVLGGASYAAAGYALKAFGPEAAVFWRSLLAALLFLPLLAARRSKLSLSREDWARTAAVGVFGLALPLVLGTVGQKLSSATNASLLVGLEPVSIVLLSALFLGERLTWLKAGAVAAGLAGSACIVLQGLPGLGAPLTPHLRGDILLLVHSLCWSLYTVIGKPTLARVDAVVFSGLTTWIALLPLGLASASAPAPYAPLTWEPVAAVVFLASAVSVGGVLLWNRALKEIPASQLANFVFLQPLVGVLLGTGLHGESFSAWSAAGGGLILLGVWAATKE